MLGFPLKFESPGWTEFAAADATLALHQAGHIPAGTCVPGIGVPDLDEFHRRMQEKGVKCLEPPKVQEFGVRLARYTDPDGLPLSVAEAQKK